MIVVVKFESKFSQSRKRTGRKNWKVKLEGKTGRDIQFEMWVLIIERK